MIYLKKVVKILSVIVAIAVIFATKTDLLYASSNPFGLWGETYITAVSFDKIEDLNFILGAKYCNISTWVFLSYKENRKTAFLNEKIEFPLRKLDSFIFVQFSESFYKIKALTDVILGYELTKNKLGFKISISILDILKNSGSPSEILFYSLQKVNNVKFVSVIGGKFRKEFGTDEIFGVIEISYKNVFSRFISSIRMSKICKYCKWIGFQIGFKI